MSQTVGVSEWVVGHGDWICDPYCDSAYGHRLGVVYSLKRSYSPIENPSDRMAFERLCAGFTPDQVRVGLPFKGDPWLKWGLGGTQYNHMLPPNHPSCDARISWAQAITAGSFHAGGAHSLRMDGGIQFVKESIDPRVWSALGGRSGGEVVGDGWD